MYRHKLGFDWFTVFPMQRLVTSLHVLLQYFCAYVQLGGHTDCNHGEMSGAWGGKEGIGMNTVHVIIASEQSQLPKLLCQALSCFSFSLNSPALLILLVQSRWRTTSPCAVRWPTCSMTSPSGTTSGGYSS